MSEIIEPLLQELLAVLASSEVLGSKITLPGNGELSNVWTSVQALRQNVVELAKSAVAQDGHAPPLPFYVIDVGRLAPASGWDVGVSRMRAPVTIYTVQATVPGSSTKASQLTVSADLSKIQQYIDSAENQFDTFQPVEKGQVDTSLSNPITKALAAESKALLYGGAVTWSPGFLVQGS